MQTTSAKGQIREKEMTVFWRHLSGDLMLAPATNLQPFVNWTRIECRTTRETEFYSRKLAAQEFYKFRSMKVEEHLRYREKRDQIKANCRLRLAKGCISEADELATRMTLKSQELKDELLYKLLSSEPDLSRASLKIEQFDAPALKAQSDKRRGLSDDEVNPMNEMLKGVR